MNIMLPMREEKDGEGTGARRGTLDSTTTRERQRYRRRTRTPDTPASSRQLTLATTSRERRSRCAVAASVSYVRARTRPRTGPWQACLYKLLFLTLPAASDGVGRGRLCCGTGRAASDAFARFVFCRRRPSSPAGRDAAVGAGLRRRAGPQAASSYCLYVAVLSCCSFIHAAPSSPRGGGRHVGVFPPPLRASAASTTGGAGGELSARPCLSSAASDWTARAADCGGVWASLSCCFCLA